MVFQRVPQLRFWQLYRVGDRSFQHFIHPNKWEHLITDAYNFALIDTVDLVQVSIDYFHDSN